MIKNQTKISQRQLIVKLEQKNRINIQQNNKTKSESILSLFKFAKQLDYLLMAIGTVMAIINGGLFPVLTIFWGNLIEVFNDSDLINKNIQILLNIIYLGLGSFASGWIAITCWSLTGERQSLECRKQYFQSHLRQQVGWYDIINNSQVSNRFINNTVAFQNAVSERIPLTIHIISLVVIGIIISFIYGWLLTLISMSLIFVSIVFKYGFFINASRKIQRENNCYAQAGGRSQQALTSIKTVKMLNGENYESTLYDECLKQTKVNPIKSGLILGICIGGTQFALLAQISLCYWQGVNCVLRNQNCTKQMTSQVYTAANIFTILNIFFMIGFHASQFNYYAKIMIEGFAAMKRINQIINRKNVYQNIYDNDNGIKLDYNNFKGIIKFNNVSFAYPKHPQKLILKQANFEINKNKTSLVGPSGQGKSTIMQLLMRFYQPNQGNITIDDHDISNLNLKWLRNTIGYVGQQPTLFSTTIKQNLLLANQNATDEQILKCLRDAQALQFINQLSDKLETHVGLGGGKLSGGQKQRIGIARAFIRNPKILLLDEATSALDRRKQRSIQKTLNQLKSNTKIINISHTFNSIKKSDQIFVFQNGKIKEKGEIKQIQYFRELLMEQELQNQNMSLQKQAVHTINNSLPQKQQKINNDKKPQKIQQEQKKKIQTIQIIKRLLNYIKDTKILFIIGMLVSLIIGVVYPVTGIFLMRILIQIILKNINISDIQINCIIIVIIGCINFIGLVILQIIISITGDKITLNIRSDLFYKILRMPIYWHQRSNNNISTLTTRLSVDCHKVNNLSTVLIYIFMQQISSFISGIVIGFIYQWKISLITFGMCIFAMITSSLKTKVKMGQVSNYDQLYRKSTNIVMDTFTNIRTVYSLCIQNIMFLKYCETLKDAQNKMIKKSILSGFFNGLSQFTIFIIMGICYYAGSTFVYNKQAQVINIFTANCAIMWSTFALANNTHIIIDIGEANISAARLFQILDQKDEDQIQIDEGSKLIKQKPKGNINFKNINFRYESSSENLLTDFSIQIPAGQTVALVGPSGCGKSSIVSLLLRFYEIQGGSIQLDGINIKQFDIHYLRSQFGVVSQQPVLFDASFKENIIYNSKSTEQQMVQAAKKAHAYEFITKMNIQNKKQLQPQFSNQQIHQDETNQKQHQINCFNLSVGPKGNHISGGQKQRVAIARSILKNPQILLLDEATSALDSQNEKKVQQSLEVFMQNKTTVSIAHRINTIKNSNIIYVLENGQIIQQGKFEQLMTKKGYFYHLAKGIKDDA